MDETPTDQPANHDHGRDQLSDHSDHVATNHPTMPEWVTLEEAAAALGISVNAVRQRMKRETLPSVKTDEGWLVDISATDHRPGTGQPTTATNQTTDHTTTLGDQPTIPTNQQPTIDLEPLADVIRDQNRRLEELSAAAAFWQFRAQQAEEQLKQLTAGPRADNATEGPESAGEDANVETYRARTENAPRGILARLRRLVTGNR